MDNSVGSQLSHVFFVLVLIALVGGLTGNAVARKLPPANAGDLQKAQHLAERVFAETGDAAGAVKVLEDKGIAGLVGQRPAGFSAEVYAELLETYAGFLTRLPERRREAAVLLKTVIETDPDRTSAYLDLGDLYYRLHQDEPRDEYLEVYTAAYEKYVERLRKQARPILLSSSVVEAAYAAEGLDICGITGRLLQTRQLADLDLFFNPETGIEDLTKTDAGGEGMPVASFAGFINGSAGVIRKSSIDVDNDGQPETRYSAATSAGDCRRNVFYRRVDDRSALLSNDLLDGYYEPDRLCGGGRISFVRFRQQNYLLERHPLQENRWKLLVFRLTPAGGYSQLCTVQPPAVSAGNDEN